MKIRLLKSKAVKSLSESIADNLSNYRNGNFNFLVADPSNFFEIDSAFDELQLALIDGTASNHKEVDCCLAMNDALGFLSPYLARDPRLWIYLTHTFLLEYSRNRWPIPENDQDAITHIRKHFFAAGTRGIERDNAASRLWWMAALCSRVEGLTLKEALTSFLHQYDVRANIVERPTTSQSIPIFSAVLKKLDASYKADKKLFEREKFRAVMKELNLQGGVKLLCALEEDKIGEIVDSCMQ